MYITGCRAHLCHLPGLGQEGHSIRGTSGSAGVLDCSPMWSGSWVHLWPNLTSPKPDRLIFCHMAGWLANHSWQGGWLPIKQNVNLTLPATKYLTNTKNDRLISCHMAGWLANCCWQAGWLADCLLQKMSTWPSPQRETCGHVCDYFGHKDLWLDVPPIETSSHQEQYYARQVWHLVSLWVRLTFSQTYSLPQ